MHKPSMFFLDVTQRNVADAPYVDFYSYTAPCQALSKAGIQKGIQDARTLVILYAILYIRHHKPRVFVLENVPDLATNRTFKDIFDFIIAEHSKDGYCLSWKVINSGLYGVPQSRVRFYLIGIRADIKRARECGVSLWPPAVPHPKHLTVPDIVSTLPTAEFKLSPQNPSLQYDNFMRAVSRCKVNPYSVPVIIDTGASERFSSFKVRQCPTITRTRGSQPEGYWCSTKGGPLSVDELAAFQGFMPILHTEIPWQKAGLTKSAFGGCVGNAQAANFLLLLYPRVLFHAQLLSLAEYNNMSKRLDDTFQNLRDVFLLLSDQPNTQSSQPARSSSS